jgi:hypothetical protein
MHTDTKNALESLKILDHKQDQLLKDLDELNLRIEQVISFYQAKRGGAAAASSADSQVMIEKVDVSALERKAA